MAILSGAYKAHTTQPHKARSDEHSPIVHQLIIHVLMYWKTYERVLRTVSYTTEYRHSFHWAAWLNIML